MTDSKAFWQSKTFWSGIAGLVSSILVYFQVETTPAEIAAISSGLSSIAAIVARIVAKDKLTVS